MIKVLSLMNYKGGVRFSVLCGDRALENFEAKTEQMQTISNLLSAKPGEGGGGGQPSERGERAQGR